MDIDHRQHVEMERAQLLGDLLSVVERGRGGDRRSRDLDEPVARLRDQEVLTRS
jgi:hypothetical protein